MTEFDLNSDVRINCSLGAITGRRTPEPGEVDAGERGLELRFSLRVDEAQFIWTVDVAEVVDATRDRR
jgi:hypothetical protein